MRMRMGLTLAAVVMGAAITAPAVSAQTAAAPAATSKTTYLVVYRPGPAFLAGKPLKEQPLKDHGKYMLKLYTEGTLKLAGGFLDDVGGAMVFEAENEEQAKSVIAADPAVVTKVFVAELHPWKPRDWEQLVKK
jgi:uncharacterized protein YciI